MRPPDGHTAVPLAFERLELVESSVAGLPPIRDVCQWVVYNTIPWPSLQGARRSLELALLRPKAHPETLPESLHVRIGRHVLLRSILLGVIQSFS